MSLEPFVLGMRDLCAKFCVRRFYVGLTMLPFPGRVFSLYVGFVQNLGESERVLFIDHEFFVEDGRECKITRV